MTDLAAHMPAVADVVRSLLGEPQEITAGKQRFQRYSLDMTTSAIYDFETECRIDVVELVAREKLTDREGAAAWLEDNAPAALNGHAVKRLPEELANERTLIGLILVRPAVLSLAEEEIGVTDFVFDLHARIFRVFADARDNNYDTDVKTLVGALGGDSEAEVAPGYTLWKYIAHLAASAPLVTEDDAPDLARQLARAVRETSDLEQGVPTAQAEAEYVPEVPKPWVPKYGLIMWADQDRPGDDEYEYLIEDLIPAREPVLIIGESQSGKSFLTTHMGLCGARGVPFFGRRILKPFGVVYCAYEAGKGFKDRLRAYRRHHGLDLAEIPFGVLTKPVHLWSDAIKTKELIDGINEIVRYRFNGVPLGAVIIDTHNAATPGMSEIDSKEVSMIRDRYKTIMNDTGAGCWIIGHKNAAGKHRGNEQLYNNIETTVDIAKRQTEDRQPVPLRDADGRVLRRLKVVKQREGADGEGFDFVLEQIEVGRIDQFGKPRTSCVPTPPTEEQAYGGGTRTAKLTMQQRRFMEALFEALDDYGVPPPDGGRIPRSVAKVVDYVHVKKIFGRRELNDGDDPRDYAGRLRTALSRSRKELGARAIIATDSPFIWWTGRAVDGVRRGLFEGPVTSSSSTPENEGA